MLSEQPELTAELVQEIRDRAKAAMGPAPTHFIIRPDGRIEPRTMTPEQADMWLMWNDLERRVNQPWEAWFER